MADKTSSVFPKDAIPRRWRDNLVPAGAVGVPDPVATASERLRVTGLASEKASRDRREAEAAAKAAPRLDQEAAIEAVECGEDPPPATAAEKERAAETARQREVAAKAIAQRAAVALERAYRDHAPAWLGPQRDATAALVEDGLALVDDLEAAVVRTGETAAIVRSLQTKPLHGGAIEQCRSFKSTSAVSDALRVVGELREAIRGSMPDPLPADGPLTPEQEALRDTQRAYRQMGQGGVVVSGSGGLVT